MNVLIVEDSQNLSGLLKRAFEAIGSEVRQAFSLRMAQETLRDFWPDAVILDAMFPDGSGGADFNAPGVLNLLEVRPEEDRPFVILMSGDDRAAGHFETIRDWWRTGRIADAVSKNQEGGWEFFKEILLHHAQLHKVQRNAGGDDEENRSWLMENEITTGDAAMYRIGGMIRRIVATTDNEHTILIVGANGTGKGLIARAIHREMCCNARCNDLPFVNLHCGRVGPNTALSQLLGHVRGAFTGADRDNVGAFQATGRGVLFLDDIHHLPDEARAALLAPLQDRSFQRLGAHADIPFDGRVVASTNVVDLERMYTDGKLSDEFYNRIAGSTLFIPSLAQRPGDVELIAKELASRGRHPKKLRSDALRALQSYEWPGNVRQLQRVMQTIQIQHDGEMITLPSLRSLGIDYLGRPIEWHMIGVVSDSRDSLLYRFDWRQGWNALGPDQEGKVLSWLRSTVRLQEQLDALTAALQGRSSPKAIHYYKALLYAHLTSGDISHRAFEEVLGLGWDFTNRVACYLAGIENGKTRGFTPQLLNRQNNPGGKYVYRLVESQPRQ